MPPLLRDTPIQRAASDGMTTQLIQRVCHYFRVYFRLAGGRLMIFIALTLCGALAEIVGVSLFVPLFELLDSDQGTATTGIAIIDRLIDMIGLELTLGTCAILLPAIIWLKAILVCGQKVIQGGILADLPYSLRHRLIDALQHAKYTFVRSRSIGHFSDVINYQTQNTASSFMCYTSAMASVIIAAVYMLVVMFLGPMVVVISGVTGLVLVFAFRRFYTLTRQFSKAGAFHAGKLQNHTLELIGNYRYLKASARFQKLSERFSNTNSHLRSLAFKAHCLQSVTDAISEPIAFTLALVYVYFFAADDGIGPLIPVLYLLYRSMRQVSAFQIMWQKFEGNCGGVDMVVTTLDELTANREPERGENTFTLEHSITIDDIHCTVGDTPILNGISFDVPRNTIVGLVGESGSGKSTIIGAMLGLFDIAKGQIRFDNEPLSALTLDELRARIGYVTQDCAVLSGSIAFNITLSTDEPDRAQLDAAATGAGADKFIKELPDGYGTLVGEGGVQLSGGEIQRLHLARELYRQPQLLILDEASSNLDSLSEAELFEYLTALRNQITTIIIAHRLSALEAADHIYVVANGTIIEHGTFRELVAETTSQFHRMWKQQQTSDV